MTGHKMLIDDRLVADQARLITAEGKNCAGLSRTETEEWFLPTCRNDAASVQVYRAIARQLCAGCPVQQLCLDVSIRGEEFWGVWGGTSEHDRRRMIRDHRRRQHHQTPAEPPPTRDEAA